MRIFVFRRFAKLARKNRIANAQLCEAVARANAGSIDADLGGGVIKQRIARSGSGKSRGFRSVILFRSGHKAFFIHGFRKKDHENIDDKDLKAFKTAAKKWLDYDENRIGEALAAEAITEVACA